MGRHEKQKRKKEKNINPFTKISKKLALSCQGWAWWAQARNGSKWSLWGTAHWKTNMFIARVALCPVLPSCLPRLLDIWGQKDEASRNFCTHTGNGGKWESSLNTDIIIKLKEIIFFQSNRSESCTAPYEGATRLPTFLLPCLCRQPASSGH